jgi:hypothetical protein
MSKSRGDSNEPQEEVIKAGAPKRPEITFRSTPASRPPVDEYRRTISLAFAE